MDIDLKISGVITQRGFRGSSLYRAKSKSLGEDVALRVIHLSPPSGSVGLSLQKLEDDARRLLKLSHTNVLRHYGYSRFDQSSQALEEGPQFWLTAEPQFWLTAEFCAGGTLRENVKMRMMTSSRLQNWTSQILSGLSYLHGDHIVHSNLTGNNVLLDCADVDKCVLKIADLASITQLKGATATPNEVPFGGTLSYMSPEMFMQYFLSETERQFVVGTKTDIWSFGCLCLEMMSGTAPQYEALVRNDELDIADSSGMPKIRAMRAIIGGAVPSFLRKCSLSIVEFVLDCLELNPDMRWDAEALLKSRFYKVDANELKWDGKEESTDIPFEREEYLTGGNFGVQIHVGRLVVDDKEQKEMIIKTIPLPPQGETRERYIFASKRRALKILRLEHPHIVSHIDYRYSNSRVHPQCEVLMEYCSGGTLAAASRQQRPCPELFRKWCQQILLGIEYLHHWRIIHRDIKGENIFLSSPDRSTCLLKIGDSDDMKFLSKERSEGQNVSFRGTHPFLSAEMYALLGLMSEKHRVGRKTDIWSYP